MDIQALSAGFGGEILMAGASGHAAAAAALSWNGRKPETAPRLVLRPRSVADVRHAVAWAAGEGLRVSPRSGGHNLSGVALRADVVIDMGAFDAITVDPARRLASVGPAATNGALAAALGREGLAFPVGHCASVPMGGYLLGGGIGWNGNAWGFACFMIESADVVLADGSLVRASREENYDLFWALRGAGPAFFGIVTEYRLRLQALPKAPTTAVWAYPSAATDAVERWGRAMAAVSPKEAEFTIHVAQAPAPAQGTVTSLVVTVFAETEAEATRVLAEVERTAPEGCVQRIGPMATDFATLYAIVGQSTPLGARYAFDSLFADDSAAAVAGLARRLETAPSPLSHAVAMLMPAHSALRAALPPAAWSLQGAVYGCVYTTWREAAADAANLAWLRAGSDAQAAVTKGRYAGQADLERADWLEACHAPQVRERLKVLRANYDPLGVFQKRAPAAEAGRRAVAAA